MLNKRIRELRKALGLNQTDFGEKIGIKQGSIAGYESGSRTPIDSVVLSMCREFNVNEEWLRTGDGEMFNPVSQEDEFMRAATELRIEKEEGAMQALIEYWKMTPEQRKLIKDFILSIAEAYKKEE